MKSINPQPRKSQSCNVRNIPLPVFDRLALFPSTPVPWCAAGGARGGAEFGAGLARVGRLEDLASAARTDVVGRGFARRRAAGTVGQGFRAVHFVEMGLVDAGCGRRRVFVCSPTPAARGGSA